MTAIRRYAPLVLSLGLLAPDTVHAAEEVTRINKGSSVAVGTEASAGTGDVIYAEWERTEKEFARLRSATKISDTGLTLPKGLLLEASIAVGGKKDYCAGFEAALYCLQDTDDDKIFDRAKVVGGARPLPRISGSYALEYQAAGEGRGWRKEIVYQGRSAGVLRLTFRAFGADWLTPAESHEVTYDLVATGPTEVVYQGAKIQILEADSNHVRYRVLATFTVVSGGAN